MKNNGKVLVAIAAIVAVLGWWLYSRRSAQDERDRPGGDLPPGGTPFEAHAAGVGIPGGQRHH